MFIHQEVFLFLNLVAFLGNTSTGEMAVIDDRWQIEEKRWIFIIIPQITDCCDWSTFIWGPVHKKEMTCAKCLLLFSLFFFFWIKIIVYFCVLFYISCLLYDGKLKRARRQPNERGTAVAAFDFWYFFVHYGNRVGHRRHLRGQSKLAPDLVFLPPQKKNLGHRYLAKGVTSVVQHATLLHLSPAWPGDDRKRVGLL